MRLVGEWLPEMLSALDGDKPIELVPLPPIPGTPDDEQRKDFQDALGEALLTDKAYLAAVEKLEAEPEDRAEALVAKAIRALRDRVRKTRVANA